jgi:predicted MFS family arabinose efflux permease
VVSGLLAIAGQLRITAWARERWQPGRCLVIGMAILAAAFLPPTLATGSALALVLAAALLSLGTLVVFPFEMDTIIRLSGNHLVATHYGFYNTVVGVGIMAGNLFTGTAFDLARDAGMPQLPWAGLALIGLACGLGLHLLERSRALSPVPAAA